MKNAITSLLVLNSLSSLPQGALSFTARPPLAGSAIRVAVDSAPTTARHPLHLHGFLPGFLSREKEADTEDAVTDVPAAASRRAIPSMMTKLDLETNGDASVPAEAEEEEELTETKKLLQKVKQAGTAGVISYALWELGFWGVSIPVCVVGYRELTGHWPDFTNKDDLEKVGAEAFAFVNFARLAVPLRIGLALSTTSWIDENLVQKFLKKDEGEGAE